MKFFRFIILELSIFHIFFINSVKLRILVLLFILLNDLLLLILGVFIRIVLKHQILPLSFLSDLAKKLISIPDFQRLLFLRSKFSRRGFIIFDYFSEILRKNGRELFRILFLLFIENIITYISFTFVYFLSVNVHKISILCFRLYISLNDIFKCWSEVFRLFLGKR